MKQKTVGILIGTTTVALLLGGLGCVFPFDFAAAIVVGWAFFLVRTLPQVTVDWISVATAVVAFGVFAFGLHRMCRWMYTASAVDDGERVWKFAWSNALVWGIVFLFLAGTAMIGVTHQAVWLAMSRYPLLENNWETRRRTMTRNNLKQIGLAAHTFHDFKQAFPAGATWDASGRPLHGWATQLLSYSELGDDVPKPHLDRPWTAPENEAVFQTSVPVLLNPGISRYAYMYDEPTEFDDRKRALTHYAANELVFRAQRGLTIEEFTDGTSNTLLIGEVNANFRPWGAPLNSRDVTLGINQSPEGFGGPFTGGAFFLRADGSAHFESENTDPEVLKALANPAGGDSTTESP